MSVWSVARRPRVWIPIVLLFVAVVCVAAFFVFRNREPAVDGGAPQNRATDGQLPWMAALLSGSESSGWSLECGGSVIAPQWVLSARHCFEPVFGGEPDLPVARVGSLLWNSGGQVVDVDRVEFSPVDGDDLALAHLAQPVAVKPIELPPAGSSLPSGVRGLTAGWGWPSSDDEHNPKHLDWVWQRVDATPVSSEGVFWAGRPRGYGSGTCTGDSGGPLVVATDGFSSEGFPQGQAQVVGVLRGLDNESCFEPGHDDDWQLVAFDGSWIRQVTGLR